VRRASAWCHSLFNPYIPSSRSGATEEARLTMYLYVFYSLGLGHTQLCGIMQLEYYDRNRLAVCAARVGGNLGLGCSVRL